MQEQQADSPLKLLGDLFKFLEETLKANHNMDVYDEKSIVNTQKASTILREGLLEALILVFNPMDGEDEVDKFEQWVSGQSAFLQLQTLRLVQQLNLSDDHAMSLQKLKSGGLLYRTFLGRFFFFFRRW